MKYRTIRSTKIDFIIDFNLATNKNVFYRSIPWIFAHCDISARYNLSPLFWLRFEILDTVCHKSSIDAALYNLIAFAYVRFEKSCFCQLVILLW